MRLSLSCFRVFPCDDPVVQKFVGSVSKPAGSSSSLTLVPQSHGEWTINGIRHKKRRAYLLEKDKYSYMISVSCIEAYTFKGGDFEKSIITLTERDWEKKYEIEVYH